MQRQTDFAVRTPMPTRARTRWPISDELAAVHDRARFAHSSARTAVEHGIARRKNWRVLARHLGRREVLDETIRAVAGLASSQQRAARPRQRPDEPLALAGRTGGGVGRRAPRQAGPSSPLLLTES